jgi:hypothetical protein
MATGPEHYRKAEELISTADEWMDADLGWKAHLSAQERIDRRSADLAAAQVHATLALAAATALNDYGTDGMRPKDYNAWHAVASEDRAEATALADVDPVTGRDYAEEAWQRAEAEREGAEELADWERELLANATDPTPEEEAANAAALAATEAHHASGHDMATCPECRDQYEAEQAEDREGRYTDAQLDGTACVHCDRDFNEGERTVPTGVVIDGAQLFAHADCVEPDDEPMTNRDVDPDAYADPYLDKLGYNESEAGR